MRHRLVVVDYDRTITDESLRAHPEALAALREQRERGVRTALVTGRFASFAPKFQARHPGVVDGFVMENGCIGLAGGRREVLCDPGGREELLARIRTLPVAWAAGEIVVSVEAAARDRVLPLVPPGFEAIFNVDALMLVPRSVSKASGIAWLQRRWEVAPEATAGFGDGENDLCFRERCGFLGVPANAVPALKAVADAVSPRPYGAGTAELLRGLAGGR